MVPETADLITLLVECLQVVVALPEEDTQVVDPLALQEAASQADMVVLVGVQQQPSKQWTTSWW